MEGLAKALLKSMFCVCMEGGGVGGEADKGGILAN